MKLRRSHTPGLGEAESSSAAKPLKSKVTVTPSAIAVGAPTRKAPSSPSVIHETRVNPKAMAAP